MLHEMSWPEAKEYFAKNDIAILPVGSNEQHGPHNPLGTDHLIAKSIAEEAAKRTGVLCLQVIPFGISPEHKQFWGTIIISPETFKNYVKETCLSLNYYGVKKIVIVNGHGTNVDALMHVGYELREEGVFISIFGPLSASRKLLLELFEPDERRGHAGSEETSVNLALYPHLVDMNKAVDEDSCKYERLRALKEKGIFVPADLIDESSSGVLGRSSTASAEKGRKIFEVAVSELVKHVNLFKNTTIEDLMRKPKV